MTMQHRTAVTKEVIHSIIRSAALALGLRPIPICLPGARAFAVLASVLLVVCACAFAMLASSFLLPELPAIASDPGGARAFAVLAFFSYNSLPLAMLSKSELNNKQIAMRNANVDLGMLRQSKGSLGILSDMVAKQGYMGYSGLIYYVMNSF